MRMTSRDKELIFLVISLGIVAASWFVGARLINSKTEEFAAQNIELQSEYDERMKILEKKEQYVKDTKTYNDAYQMMMETYPAGISKPQQIMFVAGLEKQFNTQIVSVSYTDEWRLYDFQSVDKDNSMPNTLISANIQIPVTLGYNEWKDFLDYVFSYEDKCSLPEVSATYDEVSGNVEATVTLTQYAVKGENRILEEPQITAPLGTDNIFKSSTQLTYDGSKAEQIEKIKRDHDCYVMLYPSASDVKAKVIAGPDEVEKVISESNEEEVLLITAQESDGICSITYTLGGGTAHELSDVTGDTLDIYVLSSPRMGNADVSGVKVQIDNQTSKTMRIAVTGDDSTRPRFTVESQNGNVEILDQK